MEGDRDFLKNPIPVVYEDEAYMVFNKPAGLLVIPTARIRHHTLNVLVNDQYRSQLMGRRLYPCHRLDRETSGLIIYAKGKAHQKSLREAFYRHQVIKQYVAFVHGHLKRKQDKIQSWITDFEEARYSPFPHPRPAVTFYKVLAEGKAFSIVSVRPLTGRTNQIRIHFCDLKNPLIGESKYAFRRDYTVKFKRTALHAQYLEWMHPLSHKRIRLKIPLPEDMRQFLSHNGLRAEDFETEEVIGAGGPN